MTDGIVGPTLTADHRRSEAPVALFDECSRLCPHGQYSPAERLECFLDLLSMLSTAPGLPDKLYTDHGALFVSQHLQTVCANFGFRLIRAKPYAAWSKGEVERFFPTVQSDFGQRLVFAPAEAWPNSSSASGLGSNPNVVDGASRLGRSKSSSAFSSAGPRPAADSH